MYEATPYGYHTEVGYKGRLPDGSWMIFSTYADYLERLRPDDETDGDAA